MGLVWFEVFWFFFLFGWGVFLAGLVGLDDLGFFW